MSNDPFVLEPHVWFAVLCGGLAIDKQGRINLQGVFSQHRFFVPPPTTGIQPHAHLRGVIAIGLSGGEGQFEAEIDLRDMDDKILWARPEGKWTFEVGLGAKPSAFLGQEVNLWLTAPGRYYFLLRLSPGHLEHRIHLEVAENIGPAQPEGPPSGGPTG